MRTIILFLFILLLNSISTTLVAADADKEAPKVNEVTAGIVINDSLKKLMNIEGVPAIYSSCEQDFAAESVKRAEKVINCLWEKVKLKPKIKQAVQEAYIQDIKNPKIQGNSNEDRSPASNSPVSLTSQSINVGTDYKSDPAVNALSEFYGKKLATILNPEVALTNEERKGNTILAVDQSKFIDLYKSGLGKTIIGAFTSYCLDTEPSSCSCNAEKLQACVEEDKSKCPCATCSISEDKGKRAEHHQENLKSLKFANLATDSADSIKWKMCILSVTNSCKEDSTGFLDQSETVKRSCLVMNYVKAARKNIIAADKQVEFYNELSKNQTTQIARNMKEITDIKKVSSDSLLDITSSDVKDALAKPIAATIKDFEDCYKDNVIVNVAACKKYLNTNTEENKVALAELGMRQIAQESLLEKELESDERVRDYLKEEGYSSDQIQTMTENKESIADVKGQILKRYANQKAAIIKEMAEKIADKTSETEGEVTQRGDVPRLEKIKKELESRSADLENLVYFNNVVSSYLEIDDNKGNKIRNTASLFSEANSLEKEQASLMKKQIEDAKLKDQKGTANTTNLDVQTINSSFLHYDTRETGEQ